MTVDTLLPAVSVVIPCRDRADTVAEAVQSVLDQDYPDFEVIAVDDGSEDGTLDILNAIADPRLRVLSNPGPRGPSATRNFGVRHAHAPWIAFQDSDDLWLPGKLRRQMEAVHGSEDVAVYCAMAIKPDTTADSPVTGRVPRPDIKPLSGDIIPSLLRDSFISTQMLVLRHDVFDAVGGFDESLSALVDWELMLRVAQAGPVRYVDAELVVQRLSGNSITRSSARRVEAQIRILRKHKALFEGDPRALARHHHRIAGGLRRLGRKVEAMSHSLRAIRQVLRLQPQ